MPNNYIAETAERIVIDYANLSGRESANRAEFRQRVIKHLEALHRKEMEEVRQHIRCGKCDGAKNIEHTLACIALSTLLTDKMKGV